MISKYLLIRARTVHPYNKCFGLVLFKKEKKGMKPYTASITDLDTLMKATDTKNFKTIVTGFKSLLYLINKNDL